MSELQEPEQQWEAATAITLMRIYDMLTILCNDVNPEATQKLLELHSNGIIVNELPSMNMGAEDES